MAYQDLGELLPAETHYTEPGAWEAAARGWAAKKADYLSRMDMFYKQLEENARQFDLALQQRQHEFKKSRPSEWEKGISNVLLPLALIGELVTPDARGRRSTDWIGDLWDWAGGLFGGGGGGYDPGFNLELSPTYGADTFNLLDLIDEGGYDPGFNLDLAPRI